MVYLADVAIGAGIGVAHGTMNALVAIVVAAVVIFITALPLAYSSARYNLDLDLVTPGARAEVGPNIPLWLGYPLSTVVIIPLVVYGTNTWAKVQVWTTPIWLFLMIAPVAYLMISQPSTVQDFLSYRGESGSQSLTLPK